MANPQLPPVTFSLSPGVANPTVPWNYGTKGGMTLYYAAITALSPKYEGDERSLKVLLSGLTSKANRYGWESLILMIPDGTGVVRNLLKHYTSLTLGDVKAHALTYIGQPTRASQASAQLALCILASMGEDFLIKLLTRVNDCTVQGTEDGPCMLKSVISIVTIESKSSLPLIKKILGNLGELMKEVKSDIYLYFLLPMMIMHLMITHSETGLSHIIECSIHWANDRYETKAVLSHVLERPIGWA
jgi:hypothetical protein